MGYSLDEEDQQLASPECVLALCRDSGIAMP